MSDVDGGQIKGDVGGGGYCNNRRAVNTGVDAQTRIQTMTGLDASL